MVGEVLYVGSCNGVFRALDRRTGQVKWATTVNPGSGQYFFHGDPLIAGDVVVVGADGPTGNVHAFDTATGRERWKFAAGRGVASPISGFGRRAYAASLSGEILSLDVADGAVRWTLPLRLPGWEGPAVADQRVFAGATNGSLYALNADTGREEWRVTLGPPLTTAVHASDGDLYVGGEDGTLYRVDARNGSVLGSRKLSDDLSPRGMPVRSGDTVLVLLSDKAINYRELVSVDRGLKTVTWRVKADTPWSTTRVFVWRDLVVLGGSSGEVVAYCRRDGSKAWSHTVPGTVRSVGGSDDLIYAGTTQGSLYALRPRSCENK